MDRAGHVCAVGHLLPWPFVPSDEQLGPRVPFHQEAPPGAGLKPGQPALDPRSLVLPTALPRCFCLTTDSTTTRDDPEQCTALGSPDAPPSVSQGRADSPGTSQGKKGGDESAPLKGKQTAIGDEQLLLKKTGQPRPRDLQTRGEACAAPHQRLTASAASPAGGHLPGCVLCRGLLRPGRGYSIPSRRPAMPADSQTSVLQERLRPLNTLTLESSATF